MKSKPDTLSYHHVKVCALVAQGATVVVLLQTQCLTHPFLNIPYYSWYGIQFSPELPYNIQIPSSSTELKGGLGFCKTPLHCAQIWYWWCIRTIILFDCIALFTLQLAREPQLHYSNFLCLLSCRVHCWPSVWSRGSPTCCHTASTPAPWWRNPTPCSWQWRASTKPSSSSQQSGRSRRSINHCNFALSAYTSAQNPCTNPQKVPITSAALLSLIWSASDMKADKHPLRDYIQQILFAVVLQLSLLGLRLYDHLIKCGFRHI